MTVEFDAPRALDEQAYVHDPAPLAPGTFVDAQTINGIVDIINKMHAASADPDSAAVCTISDPDLRSITVAADSIKCSPAERLEWAAGKLMERAGELLRPPSGDDQ